MANYATSTEDEFWRRTMQEQNASEPLVRFSGEKNAELMLLVLSRVLVRINGPLSDDRVVFEQHRDVG
jgi:hypothetical protein